ncbi:hypothetical protein [Sphingomonas sp.]|uniref:hypothetical protein n=1 Tax=Sphingomonas sp. TaxID=28214 RepID=UPI003F712B32
MEVTDLKRDQPGDEAFRAVYETIIPRDDDDPLTPNYEDLKFATGIVTHDGVALFVQVSEKLVELTGGDADMAILSEAYMVLNDDGNRVPRAFTRVQTPGDPDE